jgi:stage V sporulation protein B
MNQIEMKRHQIQAFSDVVMFTGLILIGGILQDNGIAYIAAAYEIFSLLWILVGKYAPDTIAAILRPRNGKNQYRNISKVRRRLISLSVFTGLAGALVMAFGGYELIALAFKLPNAAYLAWFLAPTFFLKKINSALLGVFQGEGTQLPTSVASVLRVVFTLGFTCLFGVLLKNYGLKVSSLLLQNDFTGMYASFGAAASFFVAEFFILIFLIIIYRGSVRNTKGSSDGARQPESLVGFAGILFSGMSVSSFSTFLLRLPIALGLLLYIRNAANASDLSASTAVYGTYYGKYLALMMIMVMLIDIMLIPVTAKTCLYYKKSDVKPAKTGFQGSIHMAVFAGAYIAVLSAALSEQIDGVISAANTDYVAAMIKDGSFIVLFAALSDVFFRLLKLLDKDYILYAVAGAADVIFVIVVSVLLNTAGAGIMALVFGGIVSSFLLCVFLGFCAVRLYGIGIEWIQSIVIPAGCACVCGLISLLMGKLITPYLGNAVSIIVCLAVTFMIYIALLFALRNFREQELKMVPGGKLLSAVGHMLHLL